MKTLRLSLSIVCATILLLAGQVYGQHKDKYGVLPPQNGNNAREQATRFTEEGWRTEIYTIEDQLASTWSLMCEFQSNNESRYMWTRSENTSDNLKMAEMDNFVKCAEILTYQVQLPFVSQCRIIMMQKNCTAGQISAMERIIRHFSPLVVQNNCKKSFEIYKENDNQYTVRTIFVIDKTNIYDLLQKECVKNVGDDKDNAILIDIFQEATNRLVKRSL